MGRVKKGGGKAAGGTSRRPDRAKAATNAAEARSPRSPRGRAPARKAKARSGAVRGKRTVVRGKSSKKVVEEEKVIMRVRELDPRAKIGAGTSVQRLFRVDAQASSGASQTHLVFLDRHGLYCEHGRTCPAVGEVTKLDKSLKRNTQGG